MMIAVLVHTSNALPLLWPSLLAGSLLIALHMLVEFGALSIIGLQTFTTAIYQQFELEFSNANAAMLSAVLLVVNRQAGANIIETVNAMMLAPATSTATPICGVRQGSATT